MRTYTLSDWPTYNHCLPRVQAYTQTLGIDRYFLPEIVLGFMRSILYHTLETREEKTNEYSQKFRHFRFLFKIFISFVFNVLRGIFDPPHDFC